MGSRLPPLKTLPVFSAVAKHLSFSNAAEELCVSHSAVSQSIKNLEQHLGQKLFNRENSQVILTESGQRYLVEINAALNIIAEATARELIGEDEMHTVNINMLTSLSMSWLIPELSDFQERHPDVDIRLSGIKREILFNQDHIDLAVYYGKGKWPGFQSDLLFHNELFPVCNPKVLVGKKDITEVKFIYVSAPERKGDWPLWLEAANLPEPEDHARLTFRHTIQALQAAEKGLGIAMAHGPLVHQALRSGQLIIPVDIKVQDPNSYYLVYPKEHLAKENVRLFRDWLLEVAHDDWFTS